MNKFMFLFVIFSQLKNIQSLPDYKCNSNEMLGCWNECELTCPVANSPERPTNCTNCVTGCVCKPGFIRNPTNGFCIGRNHCPVPDDACITHEMFSFCGAACQMTCMDYVSSTITCAVCVPGYVCMQGYVRNPISGLCVSPNECPTSLRRCGKLPDGKPLMNMLRKSPNNEAPK